jgi:hypothetical protein
MNKQQITSPGFSYVSAYALSGRGATQTVLAWPICSPNVETPATGWKPVPFMYSSEEARGWKPGLPETKYLWKKLT